jgi:hypothetical protein
MSTGSSQINELQICAEKETVLQLGFEEEIFHGFFGRHQNLIKRSVYGQPNFPNKLK